MKTMLLGWEKGPGLLAGIASFRKDMHFANVSNGIIDGLAFGIIAIPLIQQAAASANLPPEILQSGRFQGVLHWLR